MHRLLPLVLMGSLFGLGGGARAVWSQVTVITPPRLLGMIEFLGQGTELNQWRVRFSGQEYFVKVNEQCEREVRAIHPGFVTPLYENMTFRNAQDRECLVIFTSR